MLHLTIPPSDSLQYRVLYMLNENMLDPLQHGHRPYRVEHGAPAAARHYVRSGLLIPLSSLTTSQLSSLPSLPSLLSRPSTFSCSSSPFDRFRDRRNGLDSFDVNGWSRDVTLSRGPSVSPDCGKGLMIDLAYSKSR